MSTDLIVRARAGDGEAFSELVDPFRRELQVHCYRMLGSVLDAEDALQETLLAAWQDLGAFEGRASIPTWLYHVATHRCLNALRSARRRPQTDWPPSGLHPPAPTRHGEVVWLEPFPDALLEGLADGGQGPEARYEAMEAMSLAFITAVQLLPPRQRAVLVLRDVLGFPARDVAQMLESTEESATSALKRARASLRQHPPAARQQPQPLDSAAERKLVERLTRAYESADIDDLVALLADDVLMAMPPIPLQYRGRDLVTEFLRAVVFQPGMIFRMVATRANGQPAVGVYLREQRALVAHGPACWYSRSRTARSARSPVSTIASCAGSAFPRTCPPEQPLRDRPRPPGCAAPPSSGAAWCLHHRQPPGACTTDNRLAPAALACTPRHSAITARTVRGPELLSPAWPGPGA